MLTIPEKISFILLAGASLYFGAKGFFDVYKIIARGKPDQRFDHLGARVRRALAIVFTQRSLFKARPIVSFLHAMIFYGFVFYFAVNLIDVIDGFFRLRLRGGAWNVFNLAADLLTAGILVGVIGLIIRRRFVRPGDFDYRENIRLQAGARSAILRDSTIVSVFILFHVGCRLMFKATQLAGESPDAFQPVATLLAGVFAGMSPAFMRALNIFFGGALWARS